MEKKDWYNYNRDVIPLIKKLCEHDGGKYEANFGQMKGIIKCLASLIKEDPSIIFTLIQYSENTK